MQRFRMTICLPQKNRFLSGILLLTIAWGAQAAAATKTCDLYFSNRVALKSVSIVDTDEQRRKGLSNRESAGVGMLFVYPDAAPRAFWMRNTLIPLTAGFLDANGVIINIAHMQPNTDTLHKSAKPAEMVLELGEGEFEKYELKTGVRLETKVCQQSF